MVPATGFPLLSQCLACSARIKGNNGTFKVLEGRTRPAGSAVVSAIMVTPEHPHQTEIMVLVRFQYLARYEIAARVGVVTSIGIAGMLLLAVVFLAVVNHGFGAWGRQCDPFLFRRIKQAMTTFLACMAKVVGTLRLGSC
jgi:hypothetical protein